MKLFVGCALLLLSTQTALAGLFPVLHDADDKPIGNVVSIVPVGTQDFEYVNMVSFRGYRAKMSFATDPNTNPQAEAFDLPGFRAQRYFASEDCSGDPIMLPLVAWSGALPETNDYSNALLFREIAKAQTSGGDFYSQGDLVEYDGKNYYIPFDAERSTIEVKSFSPSPETIRCYPVSRCSQSDWTNYPYILHFGETMRFGDDDPVKACPNVTDPNNPILSFPYFMLKGFPFSSLKLNDESITGFKNTVYKYPFRIKYLDIGIIFKDSF